ncbi:MAG: hypothetical protein AAF915_06735 [Cyanobacteria bacterium P01_D01_bin.50]
MSIPVNIRKGFSYDEALLMGKFCQQVYTIFQYDDGCVENTELKQIYNSIHRDRGWKFIHSIRNDETNVRGIILKRNNCQQYTVVFRGSILTDKGNVELTDILVSDLDWDFVNYGSMTISGIKVAKGFFEAYESVSDEIKIFFKTLLGKLKSIDFVEIDKMTPARKFACITAMADAGGIRLGADFQREATNLIHKIVEDKELGNDGELEEVLHYKEKKLLELEPIDTPVEIYVTGHSLGGGLANLCGLALERCFINLPDTQVVTKVYTFGGVKVGNQAFANYYNQELGEGMSYRVENLFDVVPGIPFPPPFPVNIFTNNGIRIGSLYLGNYASVGEVHTVMGLGAQNFSVDFGGALSFMGGIPFPHGPDSYVTLLEEDRLRWQKLFAPIRNILSPFLQELLQEETQVLKKDLKELKTRLQALHNSRNDKAEINGKQPLGASISKNNSSS